MRAKLSATAKPDLKGLQEGYGDSDAQNQPPQSTCRRKCCKRLHAAKDKKGPSQGEMRDAHVLAA